MVQWEASSVSPLSPSTRLTLTLVQPHACFVYFHAVTNSKQENCFPCITHWKHWKVMLCNIQFESLLFISWLNGALMAVQRVGKLHLSWHYSSSKTRSSLKLVQSTRALLHIGNIMTQGVSDWSLNREALVQSQTSPCGIYRG
jgi:hypothetical protein